MTATVASPRPRLLPLAALLPPLACLLWAFWPSLVELVHAWQHNPQYSHGYLVPAFALVLLWLRRERLAGAEVRPSVWGVPLLAAGLALRLGATFYHYLWLESVALLPCLLGLVLLVGGRAALRWAWPAVLFLAFMIPLPFRAASALSVPLQQLATVVSTFVMQTLGLPALSEGNVIHINEHDIGVVEACNGLNMLMVFFALATAVAIVAKRPWVDKAVILASAAPIAVVSNIARVTVTGLLFQAVDSETANHFFHDVAGWLMMPLALAMLGMELKLLSWLLVAPPARAPRVAPPPSARRAGAARAVRPRATRRPPAPPRPSAQPQAAEPPAEMNEAALARRAPK
jgi:exosortase